jgi:hypothetical protein
MDLFIEGLSFVIIREYNLVIPQLDVSKCNIRIFNNNTINEWKQFINTFGEDFNSVLTLIKTKKYKFIEKNNQFIKIPYGYKKCIWETFPDLYNCSGNQVLMFLEKTQICLKDIYIRTNTRQSIYEFKITPETFVNLNISNYKKLAEILINNGETNTNVWCSVACWWNYATHNDNNNDEKDILKKGRPCVAMG